MKRIRRAGFGAAVLLAVTSIGLPAAVPQEQTAGVLLILDGSGSMNRLDENGVSLLDGARNSLMQIVNVLPAGGVDVGLRVYGHRTPNDDPARGCADSELVVPVAPLDPQQMSDAIFSVEASGYTPIGLSLGQAAEDLAAYDIATVILVSDGEDTCAPPDPCEVARQIADAGLSVNTIGFSLDADSPARAQLTCIADATGGRYQDAVDAASLAGVVGVLFRDVPGVGNIHLPFNGAIDRALAPQVMIERTTDEQGRPFGFVPITTEIAAGETRWWRVEALDDEVVSAGGDIRAFVEAAVPEPGDAVSLHIVDSDGTDVMGIEQSSEGRVDLGTALAVDIGFFDGIAARNGQSGWTWAEMEPSMREGWTYLGYDEHSWNAMMRERLRYLRPVPRPAGTYFIGLTWDSDLEATTTVDLLIGVNTEDLVDWQPPQRLVGAVDPAAPEPITYVPPFDPWPMPNLDTDPIHELFGEGPIEPGITRWFAVEVPWDKTLQVEALLDRYDGTPTSPSDTFGVEIIGPDGTNVGRPHPFVEPQSGVIGDLASWERDGFLPRPLVAAAARSPGTESPPPGVYLIGVTWTSDASDDEGLVEVRIGLAEPEGMVSMDLYAAPDPTTPPTQASTTVVSAAPISPTTTTIAIPPENTDDDSGPGSAAIVVTLAVIALGLGVTIATRRK